MKIIGGKWRGRPIQKPKTTTVRPMSEKFRAAIFDIVGPIEGLSVLDVYAGSGAAGLEALSRGAFFVEAIEANRGVASTIYANVKTLDADWGYVLHQQTVETWLGLPAQNPSKPRYDLIIADPPYQKLDPFILARLSPFIADDGLLILSHSSKTEPPVIESMKLIKSRSYGDSALSQYEKIK